MENITENLKNILDILRAAEKNYGRRIYLVGATKTRTIGEIEAAFDAGLEIIGENRPQEFRDKFPFYPPGVEKHFIGHIQENKIKYVAGKASLIHSCDSLGFAVALNACAKKIDAVQDVLIEVNISREKDKHGFSPSEVFAAASELKTLENLRYKGLMTVLPRLTESELAPYCAEMKELFDGLKAEVFPSFSYLSMGMSEDFETAIRFGSNMVRIGRGIFGERNGKN
ncbi:MAG: YggS family pyridoxal phosphate-dependent enzyme [Clostridia bacterium]|nr:YggS family pyridoxal phosphate-dependent enzyme [Clostridia bacterium]